MKEYGVASSWTPILLLMLIKERSCQGQLVLGGMGMLYSYLVKENLSLGILRAKSFKDLRMIGNHNTFIDSYIESLVLLDKAANGAVTYQGE